MTAFDAHGRFCTRRDGGLGLMQEFRIDPAFSPAFATALASLSGQLEDASTDEALDEATLTGIAYLSAGIISLAQVEDEIQEVIAEVMKWGEAVEASMN